MKGIFLDIETTGLNPLHHRPINIAFHVLDLETEEVLASYDSVVFLSTEDWEQKDPASIAINGFSLSEIRNGKDLKTIGKEIVSLFNDLKIQRGEAVFICQNPSFDRGFFNHFVDVYLQESLNWPYHWLDLASMFFVMITSKNHKNHIPIPEKMSLSKNEIAKYFGLPKEEEPHKAMKGVDHLILCYKKVLQNISEER